MLQVLVITSIFTRRVTPCGRMMLWPYDWPVNVTTDNALHLLLDRFMATARIRVFKDLEKVVLARAV